MDKVCLMINAAEHRGIQSDFILNVPGQNLETDNIVFTVKWIIQSFLKEYGYLLENDRENVGRPKTYKTDELLGFIVWGILNNKNSCI